MRLSPMGSAAGARAAPGVAAITPGRTLAASLSRSSEFYNADENAKDAAPASSRARVSDSERETSSEHHLPPHSASETEWHGASTL